MKEPPHNTKEKNGEWVSQGKDKKRGTEDRDGPQTGTPKAGGPRNRWRNRKQRMTEGRQAPGPRAGDRVSATGGRQNKASGTFPHILLVSFKIL